MDMLIKQGEIWQVDFNPTLGSEMNKLRPALVINGDYAIGLDLKIILPITSWRNEFDKLWWLYKLNPSIENGMKSQSVVNCYQIRCVSDLRFIKKIGYCNADLEEIIAISQNCIEII